MLTYRRAIESDLDILFRWANDPDVRENSFHSSKIKYEDHINWFYKRINDPGNFIILIFEITDNPFGVVRFERENYNDFIISISIDKEMRGKGFASKMISEASKYLMHLHPDSCIMAFIKKVNLYSIAAFKNAGYSDYQEEDKALILKYPK